MLTYGQIMESGGKEHEHHWKNTCPECGRVQTCRCSAPKEHVQGLCYYCCEKMGIDYGTGQEVVQAADRVERGGQEDYSGPDPSHNWKLGKKASVELPTCKMIKPPKKFDFSTDQTKPVVFLAGSIDMGDAIDWQQEVYQSLQFIDCVVLNPRRDDWDKSWKQEKDNPQFREQVEWELKGMEQSNLIAMCLTKKSKAPISLLELGIHAAEGKMIVCCPEGFYRKGNVDIVCEKYGVPVLSSYTDFQNEVRRVMLSPVTNNPFKMVANELRFAKREMMRTFIAGLHSFGSPLRSRPDYGEMDPDIEERMKARKQAEELNKIAGTLLS